MPDQFAIVEFQTPTSTGTQVVSSTDITDFNAAVIYITHAVADATDRAGVVLGVGLVAGTDAVCGVSRYNDGGSASGSVARHYASNTQAVVIPDLGSLTQSVVEAEIDATYSGTDGFRLTYTKASATSFRCVAILFGGLTNASLDAIASTSTLASENTPNFQPDVVVTLPFKGSSGDPFTANVDALVRGMGFVTATGQGSLHGEWAFGVSPVDCDAAIRSARGAGTVMDTVEMDVTYALTGTGYTHQASSGTVASHNLALQFSDSRTVAVDVEVSTASATVQSFSGAGVVPVLVLAASSRLSATDSLEDGATASSWGLHAFTLDDAISASASTQEGVTTTNANTRIESGVPFMILGDDGTVAARASLDQFDAAGYDLDFSVASESTRFLALVIQRSTVLSRVDEGVDLGESLWWIRGLPAVTVDEGVDIGEQIIPVLGLPPESSLPSEPGSRLSTSQPGLAKGRIASPSLEFREN